MARPRAHDWQDKRDAILRAATVVFARDGYHGSGINDIAAEAAISKANLYHYYSNKDELLHAVIHAHLTEIVDALESARDPTLAAEAQLQAFIGALLDTYRDADAQHRVQVHDMGSLPDDLQADLKALERDIVAVFSTALTGALPALAERRHLLKPVTMSLFGMLNWHYMWFRSGGSMSRDRYSQLAFDIILGGAREALARDGG
ncbi:MAG: TetR/AcrR family transcriptional regulator [Pseudomonadota bacterium]